MTLFFRRPSKETINTALGMVVFISAILAICIFYYFVEVLPSRKYWNKCLREDAPYISKKVQGGLISRYNNRKSYMNDIDGELKIQGNRLDTYAACHQYAIKLARLVARHQRKVLSDPEYVPSYPAVYQVDQVTYIQRENYLTEYTKRQIQRLDDVWQQPAVSIDGFIPQLEAELTKAFSSALRHYSAKFLSKQIAEHLAEKTGEFLALSHDEKLKAKEWTQFCILDYHTSMPNENPPKQFYELKSMLDEYMLFKPTDSQLFWMGIELRRAWSDAVHNWLAVKMTPIAVDMATDLLPYHGCNRPEGETLSKVECITPRIVSLARSVEKNRPIGSQMIDVGSMVRFLDITDYQQLHDSFKGYDINWFGNKRIRLTYTFERLIKKVMLEHTATHY